jgi:Glycosyltransferase sugar-binding region containing DXD motif
VQIKSQATIDTLSQVLVNRISPHVSKLENDVRSRDDEMLSFLMLMKAKLRRRHTTIAVFSVLAILYFRYCGVSTSNSSPEIKLSEESVYVYNSPFRRNPDLEFESHLDTALREIQARNLPIEESVEIPRNIWQIWKTENQTETMTTWTTNNPGYEYKVITDPAADEFVENYFSSMPELVHIYKTFPGAVQRADLLRYLLLFAYGGKILLLFALLSLHYQY